MRSDAVQAWQARHPFTLGLVVYPRDPARYPGLAGGNAVHMRGESVRGLWIAFAGIAYEFPADDFTAVPPMPAAWEEPDAGEA